MKLAKNDRLALVPFAGAAFLQCPLTLDEQAFRQCVEALEVGIIPRGGTALTEAIETALTAYKEGDNYKILVLFTDGEDHESGQPEDSATEAPACLAEQPEPAKQRARACAFVVLDSVHDVHLRALAISHDIPQGGGAVPRPWIISESRRACRRIRSSPPKPSHCLCQTESLCALE